MPVRAAGGQPAMKRPPARILLLAAVLLAAVVYAGLQVYLRHLVDRHLQAAVLAAPGLDDIQYDRLAIDLLPFGLAFDEIVLKPAGGLDPIPIRRARLNEFKPGRSLPQRLDVSLEGLRIEADHPSAAPLHEASLRLGMEIIEIDLHLGLEQDAGRPKAWRGHAELNVHKAGILRMALAVKNLDTAEMEQAFAKASDLWTILTPVGIRTVAVEFEDAGLVDRMVADRARRAGGPPSAARLQIRQEIEAAARAEGILPLGRLLSDFVEAPVRLGYYSGNTEPVYLVRLLWSRTIRDWCLALQVKGYRPPSPRLNPWAPAAPSTPGKPPLP